MAKYTFSPNYSVNNYFGHVEIFAVSQLYRITVVALNFDFNGELDFHQIKVASNSRALFMNISC